MKQTIFININAKAFIIPNPACMFKECMDYTQKYLCEFAILNNIEINDNDKMVQLWLTDNEELNCDNLCRHPFNVILDDGREIILFGYDLERFPAKLLKNIKEGETIKYQAPYSKKIHEIRNNVIGEINETIIGNLRDLINIICININKLITNLIY